MGKLMRNKLNKLVKEEKGQAFILVLIFLLVGGLIIAPLLGFMSTGLKVGQMHEEKMEGFYAADAGISFNLDEVPYSFTCPHCLHIGDFDFIHCRSCQRFII